MLQTKLYAPPLRPELTPRSRLLGRLTAGSQHALTLVSAPPGYGKTTLVAEWLKLAGCPSAWLALDKEDNDPVRFLTYFIAALQQIRADWGQASHTLLALPQLPAVEPLMAPLIDDLASAPQAFTLVLDDYHSIRSPLIHEAVEFLVHHAPPRAHLILITREDPPFSLSQLRLRGQITEIRAQDLRFTLQEATDWLNRRMSLNLPEDAVNILEARTEGWIAGLQLAALSLQGQDPGRIASFIQEFGGSDRYVMDYLFEEVMRREPAPVRALLYQMAILERFNSSLCDALTGRSDSKRVLEQLEQANLFLIPLDSRREWYRFHHLFADFLRTQSSPCEQKLLHQKAARWFQSHGLTAEAVEHALAARDEEMAAALIEQAAGEMFQKGQLATLRRWLEAIPPERILGNVNLAAYSGHALAFAGRWAEVGALLQSIGPTNGADAPARGRLGTLRAAHARISQNLAACLALAQEAIDLIGDTDPFFRLLAWQTLGDALHQSGETAAATRAFLEAFLQGQMLGHPFAVLVALTSLVPNLNRQGRRREALEYCRQVLRSCVDIQGRPLPLARLAHIPMGMLHYAANELDQAHDCIVGGLALYQELGLDRIAVGDGEWTLAQIQYARGEADNALTTLRKARALAQGTGHSRMAFLIASAEADILLRNGEQALAIRWAEQAETAFPLPLNPSYEIGYFVLARVFLAQQRIEEAQILLGNLKQSAQRGGRYGRLITIYILQALAHHALGNQNVARSRLESAVEIAAPEDYRRAFLDEGPVVAQLLPSVRATAPAFVDGLLEAFGKDGAGNHKERIEMAPSNPLPEPLSERERAVLRLVADGRSNAEIAEALVITVGTVKWHVHNLLDKLGAANRTQAVLRARELNLF